jgi:hypothetical protein
MFMFMTSICKNMIWGGAEWLVACVPEHVIIYIYTHTHTYTGRSPNHMILSRGSWCVSVKVGWFRNQSSKTHKHSSKIKLFASAGNISIFCYTKLRNGDH